MIFDKGAKLVGHKFEKIFREAALFHYPYDVTESIKSVVNEETFDYMKNEIVTPFQVTAVEDKHGCVIFWEDEVVKGIESDRWFMNVAIPPYEKEEVIIISVGHGLIKMKYDNKIKYEVKISINDLFIFVKRGKDYIEESKEFMNQELLKALDHDTASAYSTALEELAAINLTKNKFILETKPRKPPASKVISRSHQRSVYTLLSPSSIHEKTGFPKDYQGETKSAHYRRRHYRELGHKRYKKNPDGSNVKILVEPMWVGPKNNIEGKDKDMKPKTIYQVRMDL